MHEFMNPPKPKPAAPTVGRVIYVRSNRWAGVLTAVVTAVISNATGDATEVHANVLVDGYTGADVLAYFRSRAEGNTVILEYGVQNPDDTGPAPDGRDWFMGEWMPFQVGQVPASLAVQGQLTALAEKVAALAAPAGGAAPASDRVTAAILHLAEKVEKNNPGNRRAGLVAAVSAILNG